MVIKIKNKNILNMIYFLDCLPFEETQNKLFLCGRTIKSNLECILFETRAKRVK